MKNNFNSVIAFNGKVWRKTQENNLYTSYNKEARRLDMITSDEPYYVVSANFAGASMNLILPNKEAFDSVEVGKFIKGKAYGNIVNQGQEDQLPSVYFTIVSNEDMTVYETEEKQIGVLRGKIDTDIKLYPVQPGKGYASDFGFKNTTSFYLKDFAVNGITGVFANIDEDGMLVQLDGVEMVNIVDFVNNNEFGFSFTLASKRIDVVSKNTGKKYKKGCAFLRIDSINSSTHKPTEPKTVFKFAEIDESLLG